MKGQGPRLLVVGEPSRLVASGRVVAYRTLASGADPLPFYIKRSSGPFSLPVGRYLIEGAPVELIGRHRVTRRKFAAVYPLPERLTLAKVGTEHTAVVYPDLGVILADPSRLPFVGDAVTTFVLLHELGHYFAGEDEEKADAFAAYMMDAAGWNPSQIEQAIRWTLQNNPHRAEAVKRQARAMRRAPRL